MDGRERMVYIRKTPPTLAKWCMGRLTSLGLGLLGCGASEIFPLNSFPINLKEDIQKRTLAHAEITHEHNSDTPGKLRERCVAHRFWVCCWCASTSRECEFRPSVTHEKHVGLILVMFAANDQCSLIIQRYKYDGKLSESDFHFDSIDAS